MADSAWKLKVRRARRHQLDLEAALREYSRLDPFRIVSKLEGNDLVVRVNMRHEIPEELSLIVGDLLHNARSALDLLVMSDARALASESGRQLSSAEERKLSFPVTRTESEFDRAARRLERYLSEETMIRIRIAQPWTMAAELLARENEEITDHNLNMLVSLDFLYRLNRLDNLDNLDKHRQLLGVDFHPGTITLGDGEFDPIDQAREPAGEPVKLEDLDPEIRGNLMESFRKMREYDERPDSYDFYFSAGELHDGAEIGRYMRNDRGQMPDDLTARGSLRLVLWEPELMERFPGAPPLQTTVREMIDEVESICTFVESGDLAEGGETAELPAHQVGPTQDPRRTKDALTCPKSGAPRWPPGTSTCSTASAKASPTKWAGCSGARPPMIQTQYVSHSKVMAKRSPEEAKALSAAEPGPHIGPGSWNLNRV